MKKLLKIENTIYIRDCHIEYGIRQFILQEILFLLENQGHLLILCQIYTDVIRGEISEVGLLQQLMYFLRDERTCYNRRYYREGNLKRTNIDTVILNTFL